MRPMMATAAAMFFLSAPARAYVEIPYTMGRVLNESTNVVVLKVDKVNKEKRLVYYTKVADLKGKHNGDKINHQINNGFEAREPQFIMDWAEPGKLAIMFHNGGASETCIGDYWYQAYNQGAWWSMSHAEPFMAWTFVGKIDELKKIVEEMLAGKEVTVPCNHFPLPPHHTNPNKINEFKAKLKQKKHQIWQMKSGTKITDYNAVIAQYKNYIVDGLEGAAAEVYDASPILAAGADAWRYIAASEVKNDAWIKADFNHDKWTAGRAPLGNGEPIIAEKKGTTIDIMGRDLLFRREFEVDAKHLAAGVKLALLVCSDNSAVVWINGKLVDSDTSDHEFSYWNQDVEIPAGVLVPGRNVVAVKLNNTQGSTDAVLDLQIESRTIKPKAKPDVKKQ